ncbi:MAG: DUF1573 domain-containing protein [Saprospiraceae bacterium]|nr:MAG: hypothetical protein UZ09_BCD002002306 [Bacteroidetes bacterium OLB9]MCO6464265.1 DUF1573 domain-containing protein [Saprospiraceae bacterium]
MKHILFSLLVFVSFSLTAQDTKSTVKQTKETTAVAPAVKKTATVPVTGEVERSNAKMTFESTIVDYGTIENGSEPLRVVKFTNTGTDPLVITNARGSCGCTVPTWDKNPIAPGQSSTLEIRYDTKRTGAINKTVTITTNEGPEKHVLQVIGTVLPPKENLSVPAAEPSLIKGN